MKRNRKVAIGVAGIALAAVLSACSGTPSTSGSGGSASLGTVRLVLGAPPAGFPAFAPFAVAMQQGYWKSAGLNVTIAGLTGNATAMQTLIANSADVSAAGPDTFLDAIKAGQKLPIKDFFTWVGKPTWEIAVPTDSTVSSLADLKGKTIGVVDLSRSDALAARAMLAIAENVDQSAIKLLPVGSGAQAVAAMKSGKVAAYSGGDTGASQISATGYPLKALDLPASFATAEDTGFAATNTYIASHKAALTAFTKGWAEGVTYCNADIDNCIKQYWTVFPSAKPANADSDFAAASAQAKAILGVRLPKYIFPDGKWGQTTTPAWQAVASALGITGVTTAQMEAHYTNEFMAGASDFDATKITAKAKSDASK
jgi:NitT/TauT family transport system substrate-binding protein